MENKQCRKCLRILPISEFHKSSRSKDGAHSYCKECNNRNRMDAYYADPQHARQVDKKNRARNKKFVLDYLLSHSCVDCGCTDHRVLEFDHVRGDKAKEVSLMAQGGYGLKRIVQEIEKCDVRCANCHRIRHYLETHRE